MAQTLDPMASTRFGYAWIGFALAVAVHVADEAAHDFLSVYNPIARAIRERLPFLPVPVFSFEVWLAGLIAGIVLLLALSPLAFKANRILRIIAIPLAVIVGLFNAAGHIAGTFTFGHPMPGLYSAPLLVIAGGWLLLAAGRPWRRAPSFKEQLRNMPKDDGSFERLEAPLREHGSNRECRWPR